MKDSVIKFKVEPEYKESLEKQSVKLGFDNLSDMIRKALKDFLGKVKK